jgi:hypothetical protein
LKGHAGDTIIVDRVSRQPTTIERPAIVIAYTVQPDVIRKVAENESFRGRGLWARFLYDCTPSRVGQREIATPPVSNEAKETYTGIIRQLAGITNELTLRLDGDAADVFLQWETEIERMLAPSGPMDSIRDWGSKLAGATLRIAAILHCAQNRLFPIVNRHTIESAIKIARYLIPHADHVLNVLASHAGAITSDAEWVYRWMRREDRTRFSKRDIHRSGGRRFFNVEAVEPGLDELQRRGFIRPLDNVKREPGRPSSPQFEVNPVAFPISSFPRKR